MSHRSKIYSLDDARKLSQEPIAYELNNTPIVLNDIWLHQLLTERFEPLQRSRLILAHEARVANHVSGKYGGKPAFHALSPSSSRLTAKDRRIHALEWRQTLPFVPDVKSDLTAYTVEKALDGLFHYLAKEEAAIRNKPAKRTTDLLQKVFGSG